MTMIQSFIQQGIRENPQTAAREVPEIINHYISDNTRLNLLYQEVKRYLLQPDAFARDRLTRVVQEVESCGDL